MNTLTFSTNQIHLSSNTVLTGANASLYINGILVTDASNASNTSQWADFPAIANINANNKNIVNLTSLFGSNIFASNIYNSRSFFGSNINTSTLNVRGQFTGSNITASNITIRNTVSASNGNFTTTTANDAVFVNTTSIFTNTTLLASVNATITTLSNTTLRSRTANISNFYGKLMYGENLFLSSIIALSNIYGATIEGETLDVGTIITDTDIYGSNLFVSTIITEGITAGGIQIGATILEVVDWNPAIYYGINDVVLFSNAYYVATAPSRNQAPTSNVINWVNDSTYLTGNYGFVEGVGSYRCISNISGGTTSPNGDLDHWAYFSDFRDPTMWSLTTEPGLTSIGAIVGDGFSYITVGTGNFNTLNAPNIVSSNSIHSNIFSYNIYNSNVIETNTIQTVGITTDVLSANTANVLGSLTVANDSELNTLTTNGTYTANGDINLGEYGGNNMDINGRTYSYLSIDGYQTQWFNSINNILNLTTNELNVIGCATGNYFLPLRNNSIVNIGQTEFSPGIVSIYGLNLEDTYALTVYGSASITGFFSVLGDTTINALFTVNGISDLNGDTTVLGFLDCLGTLDVAGLTTFTGAVNTLGLVTIQGIMNVTGTFTSQTGMGIVGVTSFSGGDFFIGSSPAGGAGNNFNVYIYYNGLDVENITVNGTGEFRQSVTIDGNLTAPNFTTSNIYASNIYPRSLIFENSNATKRTTFGYSNIEEVEGFLIESDDTILMQASNLLLRGIGTAGIVSDGSAVINGLQTNVTANTIVNIISEGELFAQANGNFTFNSFSNMNLTATGSLGIIGGEATVIGSTGGNVTIGATGALYQTQIGNLQGGPIVIFSSNTGFSITDGNIIFEAQSNISLTAYTGDTTITACNVNILGQNSILMAAVTGLTIETGQVDFIETSNVNFNNATLSNIRTLYASNATIQNISTLRLSTGTLFANSISSINFQASNIQASNIFTSTIRATNTMTASTIAIDRIVGFNSATNVFTNNLFPLGAGSQIGYGPTLAGAGYYNFGFHRSTFTTNINPATDGATTSNNIKVAGHLSTVSLGVSTINFKPYPFISTLNNPVATASVSVAGSATSVLIQSNTLRFPFPGHYRVDQKYAIHKGSGGGTHGSLVYSSNGTVANISNAVNWPTQGMASVAFLDTANFSTFTTATTTVVANTGNLTRNLYYYDSGSGTYTANFYISPPVITYTPSPGLTPDL